MAEFPAFVGGYTRSQSPIANCGTLQNLYVQGLPPGSKSGGALYPTPGVTQFGSVTQAGGRRLFSTAAGAGRVFSVIGATLYEWLVDGTSVNRGAVAQNANPASICTNGGGGQQLGITSGTNFYILDLLTNVLTQVAFLNGKATLAGFIGGYFLVFDITTGTVYQSDLYDGLTFDPLNFFQRNTQADDWNGFYVTSLGRIFLPGSKTRDNYENIGTFPIPFAPSAAGLQPEGIAAPFSISEAGAFTCWLGTAGQNGGYRVYAASGYRAEAISTEAIDFALSQASQDEIATATGESYTDQGAVFYLLYVGDTTYTFDFSSGQWHTRRSFVNATSGELGPWRCTWHCFGFNKHLWLDATTGVIYESDISFPSDVDGLVIQRERTTPSVFVNSYLDIGEIELKVQTGVGNQVAPGEDPQITLEMSHDGGMTWGAQRSASTGRVGDYTLRVRWQANGAADVRELALRFRSTTPVNNHRWISLFAEVMDERGRPVALPGGGQAA